MKKYNIIIASIVLLVWACVSYCNSPEKQKPAYTGIYHSNGKEFAGSITCVKCHKEIATSHALTAHAQTSSTASKNSVKGSFAIGKNIYPLNDRYKIELRQEDGIFYQVGFQDNAEVIKVPMDVVVGSGTKGQTYLYWYNNKLFQLPVSYYTPLNDWCNSPGFPKDQLLFNRPILGRCLECHSTFAKSTLSPAGIDEYEKDQMIFGISCERCHGPAAEHVAFQSANPTEKNARFIINPAHLTRQQKLDNCALCHSGLRKNSQPSFSFLAGDKLDDYSTPDYKIDSTAALDVHGNQYGLLSASKCFKMSAMDCSSCHNTHQKETNNKLIFSGKCLNCHSPEKHNYCTQQASTNLVLENNCVDCHMPNKPSNQIFLDMDDKKKSTRDLVRTHLIGKYPREAVKFIQELNAGKQATK